ncbi:ATP synthase F1 subunit gamma [Candidatus Kaiserbacteria bacterium CG10_big_fil_rev_8_21_14_0_10_56_12]|uniref:ATP synthase gamma chain n=1 Tax=Candidatus Kaiserbacteria bacterium CG10_big_fil_rev_8_21_14_0_10_56_12 TaxID=1974611 RepID=A0A2H0UA97_9BACT|nr:MAG: ATP synthase F1 subunit gamma [Candidatus Kaiserbacteria bacterium CG10_big_fil_rev_8_21_14_0_10_56_12]
MESIHHIRTRLASVKNIGTITKAMEVVSATKMRRAQSIALSSREYSFAALRALTDLLRYMPEKALLQHPFVAGKKARTPITLVVLIASDRGLAGAFNGSVARAADAFFKKDRAADPEGRESYRLALVGKKLASYAQKSGFSVVETFTNFGDYATADEVLPLTDMIMDGYRRGKWERIVVVSTHFKTTLAQFTVTRQILPMSLDQVRETAREIVPEHGRFAELRDSFAPDAGDEALTEYLFEPSPERVLSSILKHLVAMQFLHLVLEANASEHSARMVAMKNASTNSKELGDTLTLSFNNARQALITKEMIEISSAQVAAN